MKIKKSKLKEIIREEYEAIKEADMASEKIPGDLKRFMDKFIDKLKDKKLTRNKQGAHYGVKENQFKMLQTMWLALNDYEEKN